MTLVLLLFSHRLFAEELEIKGGNSPDNRYSIYLEQSSDDHLNETDGILNYRVVFRDNKTKKTQVLTNGPQGFCSFKGSQDEVNSRAWWNFDGHFVALCFRTTRHSREPCLYYVNDGNLVPIPLPDYDAVIYGRLGVQPFNGHYVRCPIEWSDINTLKLLAWGDLNECYITLRVNKKHDQKPEASIVKIEKGKPLEG